MRSLLLISIYIVIYIVGIFTSNAQQNTGATIRVVLENLLNEKGEIKLSYQSWEGQSLKPGVCTFQGLVLL
ncbi:hypothetical protein ACT6NV_00685 [Robiginitalea sp. IMCC44478]|uniref:hypothetical protein n=1 Tax=Robiginitalea sp. IMCC44478 TaxID=3459122 RepID=UPI004043884F